MRSWRNSDAWEGEFVDPGLTSGEYTIAPSISDNADTSPYSLPLLYLYVFLTATLLLFVGFGLTWFSFRGIKEFGWPFAYGGLLVLFLLAVTAEVANRLRGEKGRSHALKMPPR